MHSYLEWARRRIDEMDATLASLEAKASQVKAASQTKADQLIGDLKKQRDEFHAKVNGDTQAGEVALQAAKAQLELQWSEFERQVKTYFDTVGKEIEQQQATFRDIAAAQVRAWHEAADKLRAEACSVAAVSLTAVDAALKRINQEAAEAEARLQKLKQSGSESWAALSEALTESRKAFDRANQEAWTALNGVPKS
jgi:hypothetical protein